MIHNDILSDWLFSPSVLSIDVIIKLFESSSMFKWKAIYFYYRNGKMTFTVEIENFVQ